MLIYPTELSKHPLGECWYLVVQYMLLKKESFCFPLKIYLLTLFKSFKIQWITICYRELLMLLLVTQKFIEIKEGI